MKSGGGRLAGWLVVISLSLAAAAGFAYLAGLSQPSPISAAGDYEGSGDSDQGHKRRSKRALDEGTPTLEIPAIGVDTPVVSLEKNADGTLETPTDYEEAGWWSGGPMPGEHGAAVITGHVDSAETGPAVFYRLAELAPGDTVRFTTPSGKRRRFKVERTERYSKDAFPTLRVYGRTPGPRLRLVTCTGAFDTSSGHYRDNLVVYARPA